MDESDQLGKIRQLSRSNSPGEGTDQLRVGIFTGRADPYLNEEEVTTERYGECQKNHAAAIGGNTRDGCGEFMPTGEGTSEALKCAACNCHRNFHRKEILPFHPFPLICSRYTENYANLAKTRTILIGNGMGDGKMNAGKETKKRFRTKFTIEQKEKMFAFAEKAEWKIHKLEDSEVQQFCLETGIKKRVLTVWIHNNKSSRHKRKSNTSTR
ncbi:hypothetical protein MLD38_035793 [Melastoma candidum]|uniref:Uncharacterized protein n=1 Tax=Melastoma candidum TaxID=119954 RepID=A0ACB9LHN5_9MYRT|nr:hypothetical protein MLD38_035793 [Melastoma candidum]